MTCDEDFSTASNVAAATSGTFLDEAPHDVMLVSRAAERTLRRTPAVRHARPVPETQDNDHLTPTGSCLCGAVTYAVSGRLRPVINCHCERCRRFTGHHMAATSAATTDVTVDDRAGQLTWYPVPGAEYAFCRTCGGSLFWRADAWPRNVA